MTVEQSSPTTLRRLSARLALIRDDTDDDKLSAGFLLVATILALVWANIGDSYESFWHTRVTIQISDYGISLDLKHWVNDGLMTLFFFVVGLEVKRELTIGELTDRARAAVPLLAAIAGLALPAVLFLILNPSGAEASAWGVVVSTDTAFVLGALALVGPPMPPRPAAGVPPDPGRRRRHRCPGHHRLLLHRQPPARTAAPRVRRTAADHPVAQARGVAWCRLLHRRGGHVGRVLRVRRPPHPRRCADRADPARVSAAAQRGGAGG